MKSITLAVLCFCLLGLSSFKHKESGFVGIWQISVKSGHFEKIQRIPTSRSYFIFKEKGKLLYYQKNYACGEDNQKNKPEGNWKVINDSTLALTYNSCAGDVYIHWEQVKNSKNKLQFRPTVYAGDHE